MMNDFLVAKRAGMTIRIVPTARFIATVVDERRARLCLLDDAIDEGRAQIPGVAILAVVTFLLLFAALAFIDLRM